MSTEPTSQPPATYPVPPVRKRRRLTMLREFSLADVITLGNASSGMGAVLSVMNYLITKDMQYLWLAFGLLPLALILDYLDGRVARWRRKSSPFGEYLDSLADIISFGVAPAVLAFGLGMRGGWDVWILLYFVGCGVGRLARFNATCADLADETGKVSHFEGTPIPTSLVLVVMLGVFAGQGAILEHLPFGALTIGPWVLHPIALSYALSGTLMVSTALRVPKI